MIYWVYLLPVDNKNIKNHTHYKILEVINRVRMTVHSGIVRKRQTYNSSEFPQFFLRYLKFCIIFNNFLDHYILKYFGSRKEKIVTMSNIFNGFDVECGIYFTRDTRFFFHIFTRASHSWKYEKSCLARELNPTFNFNPLSIPYISCTVTVNPDNDRRSWMCKLFQLFVCTKSNNLKPHSII